MQTPRYSDPAYAWAVQEQARLRERLAERPLPPDVRWVAGADVSCHRFGRTFWGGMVVCDLAAGLAPADRAVVRMEVDFPYLPGLLGFREVPVLAAAFARLKLRPDVVLCDAHGIAHPRGFGAAAHLGVVLGVPTVGCAKSRLCGEFAAPPPDRGAASPLVLEGRTVGAVLRTRAGVAPVFVSPGHLADLSGSLALVLACAPRLRLPEPVRLAHALVNAARRGEVACDDAG